MGMLWYYHSIVKWASEAILSWTLSTKKISILHFLTNFTINRLQHKTKAFVSSDVCGISNVEIRTVNLSIFHELFWEISSILHGKLYYNHNHKLNKWLLVKLLGCSCYIWDQSPTFFLLVGTVFLDCKFNLHESSEASLIPFCPNVQDIGEEHCCVTCKTVVSASYPAFSF